MASKRKIEVFTAGCPVCDDAVAEVRKATCPSCEVIVYDLNKGCETNVCRDKAKEHGIKSVPAVAIDGQLANCCSGRGIDIESIKRLSGVA